MAVPTSQYTSENVINPVEAICYASGSTYPSFLKHGLHYSLPHESSFSVTESLMLNLWPQSLQT